MNLTELLTKYKAQLEAKRIENQQLGASAGAKLHELDALRNNLVVELNVQIGKSLGEIAQLEQVIADLEAQVNAQKPDLSNGRPELNQGGSGSDALHKGPSPFNPPNPNAPKEARPFA